MVSIPRWGSNREKPCNAMANKLQLDASSCFCTGRRVTCKLPNGVHAALCSCFRVLAEHSSMWSYKLSQTWTCLPETKLVPNCTISSHVAEFVTRIIAHPTLFTCLPRSHYDHLVTSVHLCSSARPGSTSSILSIRPKSPSLICKSVCRSMLFAVSNTSLSFHFSAT